MLKMIGGENELNNESYQERRMGENPVSNSIIQHFQTFITIVMVGYFGVKIVYALFFNIYPSKFYQKHIEINHDSEDKNAVDKITLNAYVPGVWNNEITDFTVMIVFSFIVFIFTYSNMNSLITQKGVLHPAFVFGYIIGLGFPLYYNSFKNFIMTQTQNNTAIRWIVLIFCLGLVAFIVFISYAFSKTSSTHRINYLLYILMFILIVDGIILSRKQIQEFSVVTYFKSESDKCTEKSNGTMLTNGETVSLSIGFIVWIILLFFGFEPEEPSLLYLYLFLFGIFLGIFISSCSFYGIEYILSKTPLKLCRSVEECQIIKNAEKTISEEQEMVEEENEKSIIQTKNKISIIKIIFFVLLIIILLYIFYANGSYILTSASFFIQVMILICVTLITLYVFSKVL